MTPPRPDDAPPTPEGALHRLRPLCLAYPEATESIEGRQQEHCSFRVKDKVFAWFLNDHHGDGRVALWCKALPGVQSALVAADPDRFFVPPYVGPKGWVGIRLDRPKIDWDQLADLIEQSYRLIAPKRLAAQLGA